MTLLLPSAATDPTSKLKLKMEETSVEATEVKGNEKRIVCWVSLKLLLPLILLLLLLTTWNNERR
jgi:hypothetical protein